MIFTGTSHFSKSGEFSETSHFSLSVFFTYSSKFSDSELFSQSSAFAHLIGSKEKSAKLKLKTPVIIGIAVGIVAFIAVASIIAVFVLRKKSTGIGNPAEAQTQSMEGNFAARSIPSMNIAYNNPLYDDDINDSRDHLMKNSMKIILINIINYIYINSC